MFSKCFYIFDQWKISVFYEEQDFTIILLFSILHVGTKTEKPRYVTKRSQNGILNGIYDHVKNVAPPLHSPCIAKHGTLPVNFMFSLFGSSVPRSQPQGRGEC